MRRHPEANLSSAAVPDWITRAERSTLLALHTIAWIALNLGRRVARLLLYPTCVYFLVFSSAARAQSKKYLRKVLAREPSLADAFRHYHTFAAINLDRVFLFNEQYSRFDVRIRGEDIVTDFLARGEGCLLLGAHIGSFEIIRTMGKKNPKVRVSLVMYEENARKVNSVLHAINPSLRLEVIGLGKIDSMLKVEAALARGDFVGMLGDRTIQGEGTLMCQFLGEPARFPSGPFRLATMLKRPLILMFGLYRGGNRYDINFERLGSMGEAPRDERDLLPEQSLRHYAGRLEHYCRLAPYNWSNFYDFWK